MKKAFVQIRDSKPQISPGVKVIKSADYAQFESARELWDKYQKNLKKNEKEIEVLKQQSIEAGLLQGAEEAKSRMASQILKSASSLMTQLSDVEKDLAAVVLSAVRKIISEFDDEELVFEAVKKGLQPVYKSQRVAIRVHPDAIPSLSKRMESLRHDIDFLEIMPDEKLNATDCVIESDIGIVDASIEAQLQAIEAAVKSKLAGSLKNSQEA